MRFITTRIFSYNPHRINSNTPCFEVMAIQDDNIKGLQAQAAKIIEILNRLRNSFIVEDDVVRKAKIEAQIAEKEAELKDVQQKISGTYRLDSPSGQELLRSRLEQLQIEENVGVIHLVNCNRETMKDKFWDAFDEKTKELFQFYFIAACPTQMPPSFAERMIYELIVEELDEDLDAINVERIEDSNRVRIYDLPIGRNLERCKVAFRKFVNDRFDFKELLDFDAFVGTGIPQLKYDYVAMVFEIHERKWKPYLAEYFEWIIEIFKKAPKGTPKFLFFFVIYMNDVHLQEIPPPKQKKILDRLTETVENETGATLLVPLLPVSIEDLRAWLFDLGERNPNRVNDVIDILVKGLNPESQELYQKTQKLNMSDIELLQEIVFEIANR